MKLFNKGHLTDAALAAHVNNSLTDDETLEIALHVADCPLCLDRLAALLQKKSAPAGTAELIKLGAARFDEKRKRDFTIYCVKVAACACIAIAAVMSSVLLEKQTLPTAPKKVDVPAPTAQTVPAPEAERTLWESFSSLTEKVKNSIFNKSEADNG